MHAIRGLVPTDQIPRDTLVTEKPILDRGAIFNRKKNHKMDLPSLEYKTLEIVDFFYFFIFLLKFPITRKQQPLEAFV